jgi:release factor glutamine methyltransferase
MITLLEAINLSTDFLNRKGIESARRNAELLLAHVLKCKRLQLYLMFDRPLTQTELDNYRGLIKRRSKFEPLQHLTGNVDFYYLEFNVSPSALIPRPETEILVERILKEFDNEKYVSILDIGCGSGNIGICLAVNLPKASVYCSDISDEALNLAMGNAHKHKVEKKIKFINHNILSEPIDFASGFDAVVSNPPYVSKNDFGSLQNDIKNFEPRCALTDEADGFTYFKTISMKAREKLTKGGKLFFEIGDGQGSTVYRIMRENSYSEIEIVKDYQNIDRVIIGEKK